jgi:predicted transposase YdaD
MEYDIAAKVLIEKSHRAILEHFLGLAVVESTLVEELPQQTVTLRSSDAPLMVTDARGRRRLVVLELQSEWEWDVPLRLLEYRCRHILKERITDALSCVLLLRPSHAAQERYRDREVSFRYRLVRVYELEAAAVVQPPIVSLLPFVPVMRGGGELTMAAEQLLYESALPRGDKADMLTGMAILAGLVSRELTRQLVSRRRDLMMQSYFYELVKEEWLQEGRQVGRQEGWQEGRQEGLLEGRQEGLLEGRQEGLLEGRQEGRQEGLQEGIRQGVLDAISFGLDVRFGAEGLRLFPEIERLSRLSLLRAVQEHLKTAPTPEDLRRIYRDNGDTANG